MTEDELRQKLLPIFSGRPSVESTEALRTILAEASTSMPKTRVAMAASAALDEAHPYVAELKGVTETATFRTAKLIMEKRIRD